jgi:hypothetical protein
VVYMLSFIISVFFGVCLLHKGFQLDLRII